MTRRDKLRPDLGRQCLPRSTCILTGQVQTLTASWTGSHPRANMRRDGLPASHRLMDLASARADRLSQPYPLPKSCHSNVQWPRPSPAWCRAPKSRVRGVWEDAVALPGQGGTTATMSPVLKCMSITPTRATPTPSPLWRVAWQQWLWWGRQGTATRGRGF